MIISPANISIPAVISSVNLPTEQVARDNRVREKIIPPRQIVATPPESVITKDEKQLRRSSWDPSEHPDYTELTKKPREFLGGEFTAENTLKKSSTVVSDLQLPHKENGFAVRLKLPKEVLERLEELRSYRRTGAVVAMRYQQSSVSNMPSEVLIVI